MLRRLRLQRRLAAGIARRRRAQLAQGHREAGARRRCGASAARSERAPAARRGAFFIGQAAADGRRERRRAAQAKWRWRPCWASIALRVRWCGSGRGTVGRAAYERYEGHEPVGGRDFGDISNTSLRGAPWRAYRRRTPFSALPAVRGSMAPVCHGLAAASLTPWDLNIGTERANTRQERRAWRRLQAHTDAPRLAGAPWRSRDRYILRN